MFVVGSYFPLLFMARPNSSNRWHYLLGVRTLKFINFTGLIIVLEGVKTYDQNMLHCEPKNVP